MSAPTHLCDPDGYLSKGSEQVVRALAAVDAGPTYPDCGPYQMGIVVVGRVDGATSAFAPAVLDQWGVGNPACNNGIVLALAIEDRSMYIATGRGARELVTDAEAQAIIDRMKPLLKKNRIADAAEQCVSDVLRVLNEEHFAGTNTGEDFGARVFMGFMVSMWVAVCYADRRKRKRYEKVKRVLTEIERQAASTKASTYQVESCAICLEKWSDAPEPTRVLACGHTFHVDCLSGWDRGTCPICREPDVEATARAPEFLSLISNSAPAARDEEFHFRLHRTRVLYSDIVTDSMLDGWTRRGPDAALISDVAFVRAAPGYNDGSSSGGRGGSSSFGGGSSSGGGGAGGSW